jgi:phage portal protein BeeE
LLKAIESEGLANLRDACRLYGIDSLLFGDPMASTYDNKTLAERAAYTDVYLPLAKKIDKDISKWLFQSHFGQTGLELVVDENQIDVLNKTDKEQAETMAIDIAAGILTANEARAIRYPDLGPLPENNNGNNENI